MTNKIRKRKLDHIRICLKKNVEAGNPGFDRYRLIHAELPEINFDDISLRTKFLGHSFDYPFIIEAITGGSKKAKRINKDLAAIAQEFNIGFGVGSQRIAIENPDLEDTYRVRDVASDIFLIANLGAIQLNYGFGIEECESAIEMIDADALALHLNPLQEVIQMEGNRNFSNLSEKINRIARDIKKPVIVKSVGSGISYETAKKLKVSAIDTGGVGGTSWSLIEGYRGGKRAESIGRTFSNWGIPTAECIRELSKLKIPIIASGGIRSGIDAAKSIALGAKMIGVALPLLRAWDRDGVNGVRDYLEEFLLELKISMFLTGSSTLEDLYGKIEILG